MLELFQESPQDFRQIHVTHRRIFDLIPSWHIPPMADSSDRKYVYRSWSMEIGKKTWKNIICPKFHEMKDERLQKIDMILICHMLSHEPHIFYIKNQTWYRHRHMTLYGSLRIFGTQVFFTSCCFQIFQTFQAQRRDLEHWMLEPGNSKLQVDKPMGDIHISYIIYIYDASDSSFTFFVVCLDVTYEMLFLENRN